MGKVKLYYDNTIFILQKIGGISIVFSELIKELRNEEQLELNLITAQGADDNFVYSSIKEGIKSLREYNFPKFLLPFMPQFKKLPSKSIYHSTYNRYSFQKDIIKVITIHDLGYELRIMQNGFKRIIHLFFKRIAIKNADAIICVSENTRKDLEIYYGDIIRDKVVKVIYNGIADEFFEIEENSVREEKQDILFVGGRHKYKNFELVVKTVKELPEFNLIIAGGGKLSDQHKMLLEQDLPGRYIVRSNLDTKELKALYSQAYCLIYPSSYEGFGLPVIEAMASECPIIACNNSCIREVAGNAALLINEASVANIIDAIKKLKEEKFKNELIGNGIVHSRKYRWNKTAKETLKLYRELKDR